MAETQEEAWQYLKNTARGYASFVMDHVSQEGETPLLDGVLRRLVAEQTVAVYLDVFRLLTLLERTELNGVTIHKICLIASVTGFRRMLDPNEPTLQVDLDVFVTNAQAETGLIRTEITRILRPILLSAGMAVDLHSYDWKAINDISSVAYVVPEHAYASEFDLVTKSIESAEQTGSHVSSRVRSMMEGLVAVGIPKAKYLLGYCMVKGLVADASEEVGLRLLEEASEACDMDATAALGDYYYEKGRGTRSSGKDVMANLLAAPATESNLWARAFACYTGFGSTALTPQRKQNVLDIYNHAIFNKWMLGRCVALLVAMILTLVLAPGAPVYAPHYVWGALCMAVCIAFLVLVWRYNRVNPYDDIHPLPACMFLLWTLFMSVRLLFY